MTYKITDFKVVFENLTHGDLETVLQGTKDIEFDTELGKRVVMVQSEKHPEQDEQDEQDELERLGASEAYALSKLDETLKIETELRQDIERKDASIAELERVLSFYGDPTTYHAVAFAFDRPCGAFEDDFSETEMYDYPKPGKLARSVFGFEPECDLEALTNEELKRKDARIKRLSDALSDAMHCLNEHDPEVAAIARAALTEE